MTLTLLATGTAVVLLACLIGAVVARRPKRAALTTPLPGAPRTREPDFFDSAFSLASVTRRAREEAALAGRAAAEGRPIAHRLEDLPSRRWIQERIEERMSELRRDLVATTTRLDEEHHRLSHEVEDLGPSRDELHARVDELAKQHRTELAKPRHEQDLAIERRIEDARAELRAVEDRFRAAERRRDDIVVRRDRLPAQTEAEIAYLREACDTLLLEHDMAYEAAEHRHPDKEPLGPAAPPAPPTAVVALSTINEVARREGEIAGRAVGFGTRSGVVEELPSRRWIAERFAEHIAAAKAQRAGELRGGGEELAVLGEQIREAERAAERAETLIASLREQRAQAAGAGQLAEHERRTQSAERALQAAQGQSHEHELMHERLAERQRRADADHEARLEFLQEALAAAFAEHDLAFDTAARVATAASPNGSGPAPFTSHDR